MQLDETAPQAVAAEGVGQAGARLEGGIAGLVIHIRAQGRIARLRHVARAGGGGDPLGVFIVDVAIDRAAAELIGTSQGHTVDGKADLLQVEGTHEHRVAELIQAQRIVDLHVETGQRLEHFQPRSAGRRRQQRLVRDAQGIADLVFANGGAGFSHAGTDHLDFAQSGFGGIGGLRRPT